MEKTHPSTKSVLFPTSAIIDQTAPHNEREACMFSTGPDFLTREYMPMSGKLWDTQNQEYAPVPGNCGCY